MYATIEIADQEIRLVVLEIFEARYNVLRTEVVACAGVQGNTIVNEASVVTAIREATKRAQAALGYRIERVLLTIPSVNVKRSSQRVHIQIEDGTQTIRLFHIQQGYQKAIQKRMGENVEFVNANRIVYIVNGERSTRLPLGKECDDFYMEVDLLYADKETIYSYARCVEQSNLEILDLSLDSYAAGQETAALIQSEGRSIVQVALEPTHTSLAYFTQQKLMSVADLDKGYTWFIEPIKQKYQLSDEVCYRLLQNVFSSKEDENSDVIIYIEQQEDMRVQITASELANVVLPRIRKWVAEVNMTCEPIVRQGKSKYVLIGKGSNIPVMTEFEPEFNATAITYEPTNVGARDGAFISNLGMGYVWQDANRIRHDERISVNNNELEASIDSINHRSKDGDGGFTRKMKNIILSENM